MKWPDSLCRRVRAVHQRDAFSSARGSGKRPYLSFTLGTAIMARRSSPPEPQHAVLSADQMRKGIVRLKKRIEELEKFDPSKLTKRWAPETKALEAAIDETLGAVFGSGSVEYNRYATAASLDHGGVSMVIDMYGRGGEPDDSREAQKFVAEGKEDALALLRQAVRGLEEALESEGEHALQPARVQQPPRQAQSDSRKVFVVHGHDEGAREAVARFIEKLGFEPIILHEQANQGRTIIEKVEAHGDVRFAVVILTPDDEGCEKGGKPRARARQNVVLELGYFIGRLGRKHVCALKRGDVEIPSDFAGVVYESMEGDGWKQALGRELDAAGFGIDWNTIMRA